MKFIWSRFGPKRHLNLDNFLLYSRGIGLSEWVSGEVDCCTEWNFLPHDHFHPSSLCVCSFGAIVEDGSVNSVSCRWRLNPFHESDCLQLSWHLDTFRILFDTSRPTMARPLPGIRLGSNLCHKKWTKTTEEVLSSGLCFVSTAASFIPKVNPLLTPTATVARRKGVSVLLLERGLTDLLKKVREGGLVSQINPLKLIWSSTKRAA